MAFFNALKNSFKLMLSNPKIFLPNYFSGILWGFYKLLTASLLIKISSKTIQAKPDFIAYALSVLLYGFFALFTGLIVIAMYPYIVEGYKKQKKISLVKSLKKALEKTLKLVLAFLVVAMVLVPSFFFLLYLYKNFLYLAPFYLQVIIALSTLFSAGFLLYLYFPFLLLENQGVLKSFFLSAELAFKKPGIVGKANLFSMLFAVASIALSFLQENPSAYLLFWITQFVISTLATYSYVLNPMVFYDARQN